MSLAALPPVRRPVPWRRLGRDAGREAARRFFDGRPLWLLGSGTEALAVALMQARARRGAVAEPEAILPAYGCPDLVSACVLAGVRPRLVDVAGGAWGYDAPALSAAISANTAAIVAVNLLGIGDEADSLLPVARGANALLIQDSAQHLPRQRTDWRGDAVVFSFGRGKPLNLLRGGALLLPQGRVLAAAHFESPPARHEWLRSSRALGLLFNAATTPAVYGVLSRLPGLGLGETRYKPPPGPITQLPERAWGQVGAALQQYRRRASCDAQVWRAAVAGWRRFGIEPLRGSTGTPLEDEPLRLALLAPDASTRDRLVAALNRAGVGASSMYGMALHRIAGLPRVVAAQGPFPNADDLAARLFTLPTHAAVTVRVVERADRCIHEQN